MIRIHTAMESLRLEPEELRTHDLFGFCFLVRHAKRHYISEEQYHRETCPVYGTEECRTRPNGSFYRAMHFCIELAMKNGERYLIDAGSNIACAAEVGNRLASRIDESVERGEKLTVIDVCELLNACDAPNDGAPARLISGKEAEALLAQRSGRPAKFLRTKDWQISIDRECEISKTAAFFVFDDDHHKTGVVSKAAYEIYRFQRILPVFSMDDEVEEEAYPLKIGKEYYIRISTHGETYLLLTGYEKKDNAHWLRKISDWMAGDEPLLDLTAATSDSGGVPRLMSHGETQELMRYLYEYGFSPILP